MIVNTFQLFCNLSEFGVGDYEHQSLDQELDQGVRAFELDVFADPKGGRFREHKLLTMFGANGQSNDPNLDLPGFKVMHDPNFDYNTTCSTFKDCLRIMFMWSNAHSNHLPIFVQIEVHTMPLQIPGLGSGFDLKDIGLVDLVDMTPKLYDDLDNEILSMIPRSKLIVPDDIRGNFSTLREAIRADSWPMISEARGKFIFIFSSEKDDDLTMYLDGHPSLSGRVMFAYTGANTELAAFIKRDNATVEDTTPLVSQGFILRTRADAEAVEAATGNTETRDFALKSGAHLISTDFIKPDPRFFPIQYSVSIPHGNPARCNPVNPGQCTQSSIGE